jgi:DNA alkylation repair enzyme
MAQAGAARVKTTPAVIAAQIRRALKEGGSAGHAQSVQRSFQEEIKSRGWYTADCGRAAVRFRRQIQKDHGLDFLVEVADQLFLGSVLEEKIAAIFLLEKLEVQFGGSGYKLFESWWGRIGSWADHDALVHYRIAPMVARKPVWLKTGFRWAACVALIRGAREKVFFREIIKLADLLLADQNDMSRRDWDGCCAKPRSMMPSEPWHI